MILLIDFGSTFTKLVAVELDTEEIIAVSYAPSTVEVDMTIGLNNALERLKAEIGSSNLSFERKLACSSAAGGLRLVSVGLVTELTAEAAQRAALGAGANVVKAYSYGLSEQELAELEALKPDMILLAGGTDGGDTQAMLQSARVLAKSCLRVPMILAGNKVASDEAANILRSAEKEVFPTENVMPELNKLNVEPTRRKIRELFMRRIIYAKGLNKAQYFVGGDLVPTPLAVLEMATLLAKGTERERGLGELIVIDIGGSTTDVHSIGRGLPRQKAMLRGLPEPYSKRTVEGDLGLRSSAVTLVHRIGTRELLEHLGKPELPTEEIARYLGNIPVIPDTEERYAVDAALAWGAAKVAMERHAGKIDVIPTPAGNMTLQYGKDLTLIKTLIGTGGVFAYGKQARQILEGCLFSEGNPFSLKPKEPILYIDRNYILYAMGLLKQIDADKALRITKKHIRHV